MNYIDKYGVEWCWRHGQIVYPQSDPMPGCIVCRHNEGSD